MRMVAELACLVDGIVRVMVHSKGDEAGTFLYLFKSERDGPCAFDLWYETRDEALQTALDMYGVGAADWREIDDPKPGL